MEFIVRWPTTELQEALLSYNQHNHHQSVAPCSTFNRAILFEN